MTEQANEFYLNTHGRGCGSGRQQGGVYACLPTSPYGRPWHYFFFDPPVAVPTGFEISKQGLTLFADEAGVYHVVDWLGEMHYPDIWGFIVEFRTKGMSRRAEQLVHWGDLFTENSMYILAHRKAIIRGWEFHADDVAVNWHCPRANSDHDYKSDVLTDEQCVGLFQYDIGEPNLGKIELHERSVTGTVGDMVYHGYRPPAQIMEIESNLRHGPGFIARFFVRTLHVQVVNGQSASGKTSSEKLEGLQVLKGLVADLTEVDE